MMTPSGRFETDKKLCMSISDHHPETWQPSIPVGSILMGIQAFMVNFYYCYSKSNIRVITFEEYSYNYINHG